MASKNDLIAEDNGTYTLSFAKDSVPLLLEEKNIPSIIGPDERDFFTKYIGISEDEIVPHIVKAVSPVISIVQSIDTASEQKLGSRASSIPRSML